MTIRLGALDRLKALMIARYWRLSKALNVIFHEEHSRGRINVPVLGRTGLPLVGHLDRDLSVTLARVLRYRRGPVVDIGANVGMFLKCLLDIDPEIPYSGFEPDIGCCHYLEEFIRANGLTRHIVFPIGLGCRTELLDLHFSAASDVSATMMQGFRPKGMYSAKKKILVESGDCILSNLFDDERISLIKIDVEGAENIVLSGLSQTIASHRPFLILEVSPYQHFADGSFDPSYFGHTTAEEAARIVDWRLQFIRQLDMFLDTNRYVVMKMRHDGSLVRASSVDPGDQTSFDQLNYLGVPCEDDVAFEEAQHLDENLT